MVIRGRAASAAEAPQLGERARRGRGAAGRAAARRFAERDGGERHVRVVTEARAVGEARAGRREQPLRLDGGQDEPAVGVGVGGGGLVGAVEGDEVDAGEGDGDAEQEEQRVVAVRGGGGAVLVELLVEHDASHDGREREEHVVDRHHLCVCVCACVRVCVCVRVSSVCVRAHTRALVRPLMATPARVRSNQTSHCQIRVRTGYLQLAPCAVESKPAPSSTPAAPSD